MRFQLYAPAFVVGEVKMQFVDFVVCEQVYITLDFICQNPRAGDVEGETAIIELRLVGYVAALYSQRQSAMFGVCLRRQHLQESLYAR